MKIKTIDEHLDHANLAYQELIGILQKLTQLMPTLGLEEINNYCALVERKQKELIAEETELVELLKLADIGVLSNPRLKRHRQLLEKTIGLYEIVAELAKVQRNFLKNEIVKLQHGRNGIAGYSSHKVKSGTTFQNRL
ncbi:MAG: hypothetical protein ABFS19_06240 [Thermodesulfobacteriota bacterium]